MQTIISTPIFPSVWKSVLSRLAWRFLSLGLIFTMLASALPEQHALGGANSGFDSQPLVPGQAFAPDVLLIGLRPGAEIQSLLSAASAAVEGIGFDSARPVFPFVEGTRNGETLSRIYRLQLSSGADVLASAAAFNQQPSVEFAEPDYLAWAAETPNDPNYSLQWGMQKIGAPDAWDIETGSSSTVIAIVDSGLDTVHEDLAAQIWTNPGEIPGNGIDDEPNGFTDDMHGWNFLTGDADVADESGHGTQVSGVAGAASNNGLGVAGLCWTCKLMPVKVMQTSGAVNYSDLAAGVAYAAANGAQVINLSLGGYADSTTLRNAIESAATSAVIVAGAGNDNRSTPFYPAAYPDVIAVASSDQGDHKASFSNYGSWVDVVAPGIAIQTTFAGNNGYGAQEGTSLSAPFASGLAALVKSQHPDWPAALVRQQMFLTALPVDTLNPTYAGMLGSGRIDAAAALTTVPEPQLSITTWALDGQPAARPEPGRSYQLAVTLRNDWLRAMDVTGVLSESDPYVTVTDANGVFGGLNTGQSGANTADPFAITLAANAPYNYPIPFTLNLSGGNGYAQLLTFFLPIRSGIEILGNTVYTADTTWTSDKSYILKGRVIVDPNVTLTIQPGTLVKADPGKFIRVDGALVARGELDRPIIFASNSITNSLWGGILFTDTSLPAVFDAQGDYLNGSILQYVDVSNSTGVNMGPSSPYVADSIFNKNEIGITSGTYITGTISRRIERNRFENNRKGALLYSGEILDNSFTRNGVGVEGFGQLTISRNSFLENDSYAIRISSYGPGIIPVINDNRIMKNGGGIYATGMQNASIDHNLIVMNGGTSCTMPPCTSPEGASLFMDFSGTKLNHESAGLISDSLTSATGVTHNTIIYNESDGVQVGGTLASSVSFSGNNWFGNSGYDFALIPLSPGFANYTVNVLNNHWGDIPVDQIPNRILDCTFDENGCNNTSATLGQVLYDPPLDNPDQTAPAFVQDVQVSPQPLGIQRGQFDVLFSRSMITSTLPALSFHNARDGTTEDFNLGCQSITNISNDAIGRLWVSCDSAGVRVFDGEAWSTLTSANSGLSADLVRAIMGAANGDVWFAVGDESLNRLSGNTWARFQQPNDFGGLIIDLEEDSSGKVWAAIAPGGGVASFDGTTWMKYNKENGLGCSMVYSLARDAQGRMWFPCDDQNERKLRVFDDGNWMTYDQSNGLPAGHYVSSIYGDRQGRIWVGLSAMPYKTSYFLGMFDGENWTFFDRNKTNGLIDSPVVGFTEDSSGRIWMSMGYTESIFIYDGTQWDRKQGIGYLYPPFIIDHQNNLWWGTNTGPDQAKMNVLWGGIDYPIVDDAQWLSPTHYRATYDLTPVVPKSIYSVIVDGATGTDGMEAASSTGSTFTVDYLGAVTDHTPPSTPIVIARNDGTLTNLQISWSSSDSQGIAQFRYAIGTTPGGRDVMDWKYVPDTTTSVNLTGLLLTRGQIYYAMVAAQNTSGLWSANGVSNRVVGGEVTVFNIQLFLPVTIHFR